ncbi:MAG: TAT-variant-translocated molybdopterin oxidoreductase, partial [Candidatus Marinimicrobia bacterium]|nr:TAT-variant-translocated molybdopterin oxidoreductase [Candidatus Neomarinimicrobiota bacterium]
MKSEKQYWRGFEERDETEEYLEKAQTEFPEPPKKFTGKSGVTRRSFLKAAGFTIAGSVLTACSRGPVKKAIPYLNKPEEVTPGKAFWYASTCHGCSARCGVLVKNRDGRPIKLEGNPQHPLSQGGLCAVGQASVLDLYDSQRISQPEIDGKPTTWNDVDSRVRVALSERTGKTVLLTGTVTSPTTRAVINEFTEEYPNFSHIEYDPVSYEGILEAHQELYGRRVLPRYQFEKAQMILSLDADFLGTWISPVEYSKGYSKNRTPDPEHPEMSYHVQVESRMSLTGSNADLRIPLSPQEIYRLTANLANTVAKKAGRSARFGSHELPIDKNDFKELVARLWEHRGESLVVSGSNDVSVQKAVAFINEVLGNVGTTVDIANPSYQKRGNSEAVQSLLTDMQSGEVGTLIISGVNPVYDLSNGEDFGSALEKVELTIGLNDQRDETMEAVSVHCPTPHFLESWHDSKPVDGIFSITQPNIQKLGDTRTLRESLSAWIGKPADNYTLIRNRWEKEVFAQSGSKENFQTFWDYAVHDGYVDLSDTPSTQPRFDAGALEPVPKIEESSGLTLLSYQKSGMLDGSHAHNPWLQEMPDPISKVTWDNYASIAPETSKQLNIETGDILRLKTGDGSVELPALVQPGQHPSVIAIALGYGRNITKRFHGVGPEWIQAKPTVEKGETVGERITHLFPADSDFMVEVEIEMTGASTELAQTQTHHTLDIPEKFGGADRQMVRESTLSEFAEHPTHESGHSQEDLQL